MDYTTISVATDTSENKNNTAPKSNSTDIIEAARIIGVRIANAAEIIAMAIFFGLMLNGCLGGSHG